jgi:hypothetical protein
MVQHAPALLHACMPAEYKHSMCIAVVDLSNRLHRYCDKHASGACWMSGGVLVTTTGACLVLLLLLLRTLLLLSLCYPFHMYTVCRQALLQLTLGLLVLYCMLKQHSSDYTRHMTCPASAADLASATPVLPSICMRYAGTQHQAGQVVLLLLLLIVLLLPLCYPFRICRQALL